ncbi:MAG: hypothetical protein QXS12_06770 [Candidatus Caldarchaeum sp.]
MKVVELREDVILPEKLRKHFPHGEVRKFQADLSLQLYDSLNNNSKTIVVEAPTGLGKRL